MAGLVGCSFWREAAAAARAVSGFAGVIVGKWRRPIADDLHYVPGDFYRLDDRSGFKVRAKKMRKEWTQLIVEDKLWEVRHPQDFVKGVFDDQTVPEPRPRPSSDPTVGPLQVTLVNPPAFMAGATFDENPSNTIVQFVYPSGYGT